MVAATSYLAVNDESQDPVVDRVPIRLQGLHPALEGFTILQMTDMHLYPLTQPELIIGREEGEVRFPEDGFISSRHCMLINKGGDCYLRDLGSSNGTYLRIRKSHALKSDDRVQIGNQVLKISIS